MANDIVHLPNFQIKILLFFFFFKVTIKIFKNMNRNHRADKEKYSTNVSLPGLTADD